MDATTQIKPAVHAPGAHPLAVFASLWMPEPNSGCWLWLGPQSGEYGMFQCRPFKDYAHRVSFVIFHGPIPDGHEVCHSCDVSFCVNPAHLFSGTRADNIRDMAAKGRAPWQTNPAAWRQRGLDLVASGNRIQPGQKLVAADIPVIRYLIERGCFHVDIAKVFGVHKATIAGIAHGRAWGQ